MLNDLYQSLNPIAFFIGPFAVRWYGLSYIIGFILAAILARHVAKRWQIKFSWDALLTLLIACMLGAILGARLGYVLIYGNGYYFSHPLDIPNLALGGLSFHGGLIGLAIGVLVASRVLKMPFMTLGDICSICTPLVICLVRIANFINGELWGAVTTLPWGVVFASGGPLPRHPSQLYEAFLEGLVLLAILYLLARRRPPLPRGSYFGVFLIGYGVFRIAMEFVRQPDVQLGYLLGTNWVTMGMLLSLPMVIGGVIFLLYSLKRQAPQAGLDWLLTRTTALAEAGDTAATAGLAGDTTGVAGEDGDTAGEAGEADETTEVAEEAKVATAGQSSKKTTVSVPPGIAQATKSGNNSTDNPAPVDRSAGQDHPTGSDSPASPDGSTDHPAQLAD